MLGLFLGVCHGQRAATEPHFAAESEERLKDRRRKTQKVGLFRVNGARRTASGGHTTCAALRRMIICLTWPSFALYDTLFITFA